jgi:hypothetical protein
MGNANAQIDTCISSLEPPLRGIATRLRSLLDAGLGPASATIWHGHPVWMAGRTPLAGFKAYAKHVTLMIWHGQGIDDPSGRLTTNANMGTLKLAFPADLDADAVSGWLASAHPA